MLFQKRLKGGILLYALFLSAIFALLLQVYLGRVKTNLLLRQEQELATRAYLLALVANRQPAADGQINYKQGQVSYQTRGQERIIQVSLTSGQRYEYSFLQAASGAEMAEDLDNIKSLANNPSFDQEEPAGLNQEEQEVVFNQVNQEGEPLALGQAVATDQADHEEGGNQEAGDLQEQPE